jgi:hypothetical protein
MQNDADCRERAFALFDLAMNIVMPKDRHPNFRFGRHGFRTSAHGFTVYCWNSGCEVRIDIWPHWSGVRVQKSVHGRRKLFSVRKRADQIFIASFQRGRWEDEFFNLAKVAETYQGCRPDLPAASLDHSRTDDQTVALPAFA